MSVGEMSVSEMSVGEVSVGEMSVGEMSGYRGSRPPPPGSAPATVIYLRRSRLTTLNLHTFESAMRPRQAACLASEFVDDGEVLSFWRVFSKQ